MSRHQSALPSGDVRTLDWTRVTDLTRVAFVEELDRGALVGSPTLQRVVDLASTLAGSDFAQISLIGDVQYVPAAHGLVPPAIGTPRTDSLCSITLAAGRSVVISDAAAHPWVQNLPPVATGGVRAYLGVPLQSSDGTVMGSLCVFHTETCDWPEHLVSALEDLVTFAVKEIELVATVAAQAQSVEQLTRVLQRIIAPAPTNVPRGVQLVGRYRSADVGGDWYEWSAHDLDVTLTIGDVAGHGLAAVVTMARLKALVHAYIVDGHDPAETITRVERAFSTESSGDMATMLAARYRHDDKQFTYASAGHVPPLIIRDGDAFYADLTPGSPIGFASVPATNHTIDLRRGDTVVMCTDGLYEQRRTPIDQSLETLRRSAIALAQSTHDLAELADALVQSGFSDTDDDACLVLLRI